MQVMVLIDRKSTIWFDRIEKRNQMSLFLSF